MSESIEKRDLNLEELIERTEDFIRQATEGDYLSDDYSIRERIQELRQLLRLTLHPF
jgi:hypothetical protein